jgi:NADH-quinone oxidoreductase subunit N
MLSVGSSDLVMLFVSLEVMSVSIYILISGKRIIALKNYIYGITVSAIMLFGASLMFGICGTTGYYGISEYLSANSFNPLTLTVSALLITFAIGYRMMLFPFNFSFPSYSEKLPVRQLALISITGVITSALVLIRFLLTSFHDGNSFITGSEIYSIIPGLKMDLLVSVVSAASVITGCIVILWQKNLKKIFAFIMISQSGNLIMGLAASSPGGSVAALFNIAVLLIIMTGLLYCIRIFEDKYQAVTIDDLEHKGKSEPLLFSIFIFFLSCAAGLPLTAGFSGRLILIIAALSQDLFWLAAISILSSFVMFYFIFKLTFTIFSCKPVINHVHLETHHKFILLVFLVPAILFGFYFRPLLDWVKFGALILGISSAN